MFRLRILVSIASQSFLLPVGIGIGFGLAMLLAPRSTVLETVAVPYIVDVEHPTAPVAPIECSFLCPDADVAQLLQLVTTVTPTPAPTPAPPAVMWPLVGYITQYYGEAGHLGLDIAAPMGTWVGAAVAGQVTVAGWDGVFGLDVETSGDISVIYGHLSEVFVSPGQMVVPGQAIGAVGETGVSTGPHLHLQVYSGGVLVNPLEVLP